MRLFNRGQSIIEYSLIVVLVIVGIVVMGPYVLRSVNAHFKIWDEQVQDSFNDPLTQVSVGEVTLPPGCECSTEYITSDSCGYVLRGKTVTCAENQRYQYRTCADPSNCSPACAIACGMMERCITDDDTCCTREFRGECGVIPRDEVETHCPGRQGLELCNGGCLYGERMLQRRCGDNGPQPLRCIEDNVGSAFRERNTPTTGTPSSTFETADDDESCSAVCIGSVQGDPPVAQLCPGTTENLPKDLNLRYVASGTCGDPSDNSQANKCVAQCLPPYIPLPQGLGCTSCGNNICEDGLDGRQDLGENVSNCAEDCQPPCSRQDGGNYGSVTVTTPNFGSDREISVTMTAEDMYFNMTFTKADGSTYRVVCDGGPRVNVGTDNSYFVQGSDCGRRDAQDIEVYRVFYRAAQVSFTLTEGGDVSGYVAYTLDACPGHCVVAPATGRCPSEYTLERGSIPLLSSSVEGSVGSFTPSGGIDVALCCTENGQLQVGPGACVFANNPLCNHDDAACAANACPQGFSSGQVFLGTQDSRNNDSFNHATGPASRVDATAPNGCVGNNCIFTRSDVRLRTCCAGENPAIPPGSHYCIYANDGCPDGFLEGTLNLDTPNDGGNPNSDYFPGDSSGGYRGARQVFCCK